MIACLWLVESWSRDVIASLWSEILSRYRWSKLGIWHWAYKLKWNISFTHQTCLILRGVIPLATHCSNRSHICSTVFLVSPSRSQCRYSSIGSRACEICARSFLGSGTAGCDADDSRDGRADRVEVIAPAPGELYIIWNIFWGVVGWDTAANNAFTYHELYHLYKENSDEKWQDMETS